MAGKWNFEAPRLKIVLTYGALLAFAVLVLVRNSDGVFRVVGVSAAVAGYVIRAIVELRRSGAAIGQT